LAASNYRPRDDVFPGAGLPAEQHRDVDPRCLLDRPPELSHLRALPEADLPAEACGLGVQAGRNLEPGQAAARAIAGVLLEAVVILTKLGDIAGRGRTGRLSQDGNLHSGRVDLGHCRK
jgi:hypothetical protein